ncbi:DUF551 domain-containing protein [Escherichia coli]|nr:DUF551 domain-containing protein [Escherichia coli]EGS1596472.1 DUF551 domain-containing protein [Escherichia coli]EIT7643574.1 DUF551 domain-containing protein [Escherichia coli]HAN4098730.1 DUF551 domain-containing protein [Escherichia coli]HBE5064755.1 DUF551 domain-containing protein [Escherichia coli]HBE5836275.1 DUF551 domain-containing protein [Escherichia coli]
MSTLTNDELFEEIMGRVNHLDVRDDIEYRAYEITLASLAAESVSVNDDMAYAFHHALSDSSLGADEVEEIKTGLRAAFANVSFPVTADGWISCSERMPEKGQNVLISVNFDSSLVEPLICSARYTGSTFRRGEATIKPGNGIEQATHWMPLPEPPQEVN